MTLLTVHLDHERYTKHRTYRRKVNAAIRRLAGLQPGVDLALEVLHEFDGSCCRREPWLVTCVALIGALNADGLRTLGVLVADPTQDPHAHQVAPATAPARTP